MPVGTSTSSKGPCEGPQYQFRNFPDSPVVKTSIAGSVALIPGRRTKIPQATYQPPPPTPDPANKIKNQPKWILLAKLESHINVTS